MRCLVFVCLLATVSGFVEPGKNYHTAVGIPYAAKLKALEEALMNSKEQELVSRIVGGEAAPVNAYPFLAGLIVSFVNTEAHSVCGASVLSSNRLVTAAHCWFDGVKQGSELEVVLGSSMLAYGGTRIKTSEVVTHPQWSPQDFINDIAMIYLPVNVPFSASIQPIALPSSSDLSSSFDEQWAVAIGYGMISDEQVEVGMDAVVSHVNLQVITVAECEIRYSHPEVHQSNICTSGLHGVGTCFGDSGGPLILPNNGVPTLIGISSFVAQIGCQKGLPSVFTRVTSFMDFILQHL